MKRIENLPNWCLVNKNPSFYDTESATVLEETAKVYGKMQELINDYESFANEVNNKITEFTTSTNEDQECFKAEITKILENYIKSIDMKVDELTSYLKDNLTQTIETMMKNGELDEAIVNAVNNIGDRVVALENTEYTLEHNSTTEEITLVKTIKEGE